MSKKKEKHKAKPSEKIDSSKSKKWIWTLALAFIALIAYQGIGDNEYLNYDDDVYITSNPLITNLDWNTLFTETYLNQYSPLAMGVMGLEFQVFGQDSPWIRYISVLLHLLNALLLIKVMSFWDKERKWSYIIGLLFLLQPMNVESVAWIAASMKIGTFALFFLSSVFYYQKYLNSSRALDLAISWLLFLMSCFCKEQAVVLPIVLMALDTAYDNGLFKKSRLLQKVPFLLVSIIFGLVTLEASRSAEVEQVVYAFNLGERILFSFYAVGMYVVKTFIPFDLSMFYTYPVQGAIPFYYFIIALIPLCLVYFMVKWYKKDENLLFFGAAFFFVNVALPAFISILSVRDVIMADRYTYLPSVGLFMIALVLASRAKNSFVKWLPYGLAFLFFISTFQRVEVFQDSGTLFTDIIEKGTNGEKANPYLAMPYNNRGVFSKKKKDLKRALADYEKAIEINPKYASSYLNRGNIAFDAGRDSEALKDYDTTLSLDPKNAKALSSRGSVYGKMGKNDLALNDLNEALEMDPMFLNAYSNRALLHLQMKNPQKSLEDLNTILRYTPYDDSILEFRGYCKSELGDFTGSIQDYNLAISLSPKVASYYFNRSLVHSRSGDKASALRDANQARSLGYKVDPAYLNSLK
jgi:protein O-mannosyl-transferase